MICDLYGGLFAYSYFSNRWRQRVDREGLPNRLGDLFRQFQFARGELRKMRLPRLLFRFFGTGVRTYFLCDPTSGESGLVIVVSFNSVVRYAVLSNLCTVQSVSVDYRRSCLHVKDHLFSDCCRICAVPVKGGCVARDCVKKIGLRLFWDQFTISNLTRFVAFWFRRSHRRTTGLNFVVSGGGLARSFVETMGAKYTGVRLFGELPGVLMCRLVSAFLSF